MIINSFFFFCVQENYKNLNKALASSDPSWTSLTQQVIDHVAVDFFFIFNF